MVQVEMWHKIELSDGLTHGSIGTLQELEACQFVRMERPEAMTS